MKKSNYMEQFDFELIRIEKHAVQELYAALQQVRLFNSDVMPYMGCKIEFAWFPSDSEVLPTQRYIRMTDVRKLIKIDEEIARVDGGNLYSLCNPYDNVGYVTLHYRKPNTDPDLVYTVDLLPPVVEATEHKTYPSVTEQYVCDGNTRTFMSRYFQKSLWAVQITNPTVPYYAEPIRKPFGDWSTMELFEEEIPSNFVKKIRRGSDSHKLYRDFDSAFLNVGSSKGNAGSVSV